MSRKQIRRSKSPTKSSRRSSQGNQSNKRLSQLHEQNSDDGNAFLGHQFEKVQIQQSAPNTIQTKLQVNQPGDKYEKEADRVADQVMRSPEPTAQQSVGPEIAPKNGGPGKPVVQRRSEGGSVGNAPPIVNDVLRSPGKPLEPKTRHSMESRFGHDFSQVKVHNDSRAAESAQAVNAKAYSVGRNIVFGQNELAPNKSSGQKLLAHELVHTIQSESKTSNHLVQRQSATFQSHGGGFKGILDRDRRRTMDPAPNIIMQVRIDLAANRIVFYAASGREYHGNVSTDLKNGSYLLEPDKTNLRWNIVGKGGGKRFEVSMLDVDPWQLPIPNRLRLEVGSGNTVANFGSMTVKERIGRLEELIKLPIMGSGSEDEILDILRHTQESQVGALLGELDSRKIDGRSLRDALNKVVDGDNNLQLHAVLSQLQLVSLGPKKGAEALANAPVLPWHDVMGFETKAVFSSVVLSNGKIRVKYLGGVSGGLLTDKRFASEISALDKNLIISGVDYDPDQLFLIHDYDQGKSVPVTARQLLGYQNLGIRNWLGNIGVVASLATPLSAARTTFGKAAVVAFERVLPVAVLLVQENRLRIVEWWPDWGRKMVQYADVVKAGVDAWGIYSFAVSGWRTFANWRKVRNMKRAAAPNSKAAGVAAKFEQHADNLISQAEKIRKAETAGKAMKPRAPTSRKPQVPKANTKPRLPRRKKAGPTSVVSNVNPETVKQFKKVPGLRSRLSKRPLGARLLKWCNSPCFQDFVTDAHLKRLEALAKRAAQNGVPLESNAIRQYLHGQTSADDLARAIGRIETELGERIAQAGKGRAGQVAREFDEAGKKGVRNRVPEETPKEISEQTVRIQVVHDLGVKRGVAEAQKDLMLTNPKTGKRWKNPREFDGPFGKGLDDIMFDGEGNPVLIEFKGGGSKLAKPKSGEMQMQREWVVKKIKELKARNDPMADVLESALNRGKLTGRVYRTPVSEKGLPGKTVLEKTFEYSRTAAKKKPKSK